MNPKAREHRFRRIKEIGCLVCVEFRACDIHHLNLGGKAGQARRGDEFTIGLCKWHHVGETPLGMGSKEARIIFGPSLALSSREFREQFGTDDELLRAQNMIIELKDHISRITN